MATKAIVYSNGRDEFLRLEGHKKGHQYSNKFLEKLTGYKLSEYAGWSLKAYGFIRVTKDSEGSYRID